MSYSVVLRGTNSSDDLYFMSTTLNSNRNQRIYDPISFVPLHHHHHHATWVYGSTPYRSPLLQVVGRLLSTSKNWLQRTLNAAILYFCTRFTRECSVLVSIRHQIVQAWFDEICRRKGQRVLHYWISVLSTDARITRVVFDWCTGMVEIIVKWHRLKTNKNST